MGIIQQTVNILLQDIKNILAAEGNGRKCIGFQQLTVIGAAVSLTIPDGAMSCTITCTNSGTAALAARYRMDGTAPTAAIGEVIGHLDTLELTNNTNLNAVQFISATGTTILNIHYYA